MSAAKWGVLDELKCMAREGKLSRRWYQLHEIVWEAEQAMSRRTKRPRIVSQTALSARLRELRREGITVDVRCERTGGAAGQHVYLYRIYAPPAKGGV